MKDSIVEMINDPKEYSDLQESLEKVVAKKLYNRIQGEKTNVLADINKVSPTQMQEILAVATK
jgi:hypothetical protein